MIGVPHEDSKKGARATYENSDYARLLRWRLLTAEERLVDPYDTTTQEHATGLIIRPEHERVRNRSRQ
jgi:hypothetical protein